MLQKRNRDWLWTNWNDGWWETWAVTTHKSGATTNNCFHHGFILISRFIIQSHISYLYSKTTLTCVSALLRRLTTYMCFTFLQSCLVGSWTSVFNLVFSNVLTVYTTQCLHCLSHYSCWLMLQNDDQALIKFNNHFTVRKHLHFRAYKIALCL